VLPTVYCDTDSETDHTAGEERRLSTLKYVRFLNRKLKEVHA
jgi:hypothetical protein